MLPVRYGSMYLRPPKNSSVRILEIGLISITSGCWGSRKNPASADPCVKERLKQEAANHAYSNTEVFFLP